MLVKANRRQQKQLELLDKLIISGFQFLEVFDKTDSIDFPLLYLRAMTAKISNLLLSIRLLLINGQHSDVQILMRVLLEAKINLAYLKLLYEKEGEKVFKRVLDTDIIHKNKSVVTVDWGVPYTQQFKGWEKLIKKIEGHYSKEELKKIRKSGFFGCGIEDRAKATKNKGLYDNAYRMFSKNVHCLDFNEIHADLEEDRKNQMRRFDALLEVGPPFSSAAFLTIRDLRNLIVANRAKDVQGSKS